MPNKPESVSVDDQTSTSVTLKWSAPTGGSYDGYKVIIDGKMSMLGRDVTTFTASGLKPSTEFLFQIFSKAGDVYSTEVMLYVTTGKYKLPLTTICYLFNI